MVNETLIPVSELTSYMCGYEMTVRVFTDGKTIITQTGTHNDSCKKAAKDFNIPQELDPELLRWIQLCFAAELTVAQVEQLLFNKNMSLTRLIGLPPRPECTYLPEFVRCQRFTPSKDYLKKLNQQYKGTVRFDPDDQTSVQKMLNEMKDTGKVLFDSLRLCNCSCPQTPGNKSYECIDDSCESFRLIWMAKWQVNLIGLFRGYSEGMEVVKRFKRMYR